MDTSSGWDVQPAAGPSATAAGTSEPIGYNLDSSLTYEQPPRRPQRDREVPMGPLSTSRATTGLVLGLVGVVSGPILPIVALPLGIATIVVSLTAFYLCRAGLADGRRRAVAGVTLGILGVLFGIATLAWWFVSEGLSGA